MSLLSKRTGAPLAVLAAAAVPLLAPAVSNAAIAGALAPTSTLAPDLISANVTAQSASGSTVRFCFNKTIGSTAIASRFTLNTYRNADVPGSTASVNGQCVDVKFNSISDTSTYTTGTVTGSTVVNATTGTPNLSDSTAVIGTSATNNGTRGRSTAPDLVSVLPSGNTVAYTFDQQIVTSSGAINAPDFTVQNSSGVTVAQGAATSIPVVSADRKTVTVVFSSVAPGTNAPADIANAARATYTPSGTPAAPAATDIASQDDTTSTIAGGDQTDLTPVSAAPLPNASGNTSLPDPQFGTVVLDGSTGQVDLVFDQNVTPGAGSVALLLSDGQQVPATAGQLSPNTLRLTPTTSTGDTVVGGGVNAGANRGEFIVGVIVKANATIPANTVGTVPAGGNTGAFATGFTTGPDAVATTFNGTNNTAVITLDQRYTGATPGLFRTVDNTGAAPPSGTATGLSFGATTVPGRTTITAQFNNLSGARALQISSGAMTTSLNDTENASGINSGANSNITQILAPSASTAG